MREKGPGLGASQIQEPTRALGQMSPEPVTPGEPAPRMGCTESRATGEPPEPEDPCAPPPPETHRHLKHRQAGPRRPWEPGAQPGGHRLQRREGASGPSGLTPGSGSFFCSIEEAPAQGLGARPRFPEVQDSGLVGGQQQGTKAVRPPSGVSRPRASASHRTQRGPEPIWGLGAMGFGNALPLHCLRPLTHLGHTSPFCPWAHLRVRAAPPS